MAKVRIEPEARQVLRALCTLYAKNMSDRIGPEDEIAAALEDCVLNQVVRFQMDENCNIVGLELAA